MFFEKACVKSAFLLFFVTLAVNAQARERLVEQRKENVSKLLDLPLLLEEKYANEEIVLETVGSAQIESLNCKSRRGFSRFIIRCVANEKLLASDQVKLAIFTQQRRLLAEELMSRLYKNPALARALERRTLLNIPTDKYSRLPLRQRITQFAVAKMIGHPISDKWMQQWWNLRMDAPKSAPKQKIRKGTRVVTIARLGQTLTKKSKPYNMSHVFVGILELGGDTQGDFVFNPASNLPPPDPRNFYEQLFGKEGIENNMQTSNFWDFAETQRTRMFKDIEVHLLSLTARQSEVLDDLDDEIEGVRYGMFSLIHRNCVYGARDFFNSLVRLDQELNMFQFEAQDLLTPLDSLADATPVLSPRKIVRASGDTFTEFSSFLIPAASKAPGIKAEGGHVAVDFSHHKSTGAYKVYQNWLKDNL